MADNKSKKWSDFSDEPKNEKKKKEKKPKDVLWPKNTVKVKETDTRETEFKANVEGNFVDEVVGELTVETLPEILDTPSVAVKQLALNNQLIRTYTSIEEASKHTGMDQDSLMDACDGVDRFIFGGFKWMYI